MKINSKIAAVAAAAALGTLALSAGPAFAAVGHGSGNPWNLVTARPGFTISSKSTITFSVPRGELPPGQAFYIAPVAAKSALQASSRGKIVWVGAVELKSGVVWQVNMGPRPYQKAPIHKK